MSVDVKTQNHFTKSVQVAERPASFRTLRLMAIVVLAALMWLGSACLAQAERSVTLAWDRSTSSGVTGYYIYVLEENTTTPSRVMVGNTNQATIATLKEGLKYSFTVTAFDATGLESVPSNGAMVVVPVPVTMTSNNATNALWRVQFQGAPGRAYDVQASSDLRTWTTIWQTGLISAYGPLEFEDPASGVLSARFYRLLVR